MIQSRLRSAASRSLEAPLACDAAMRDFARRGRETSDDDAGAAFRANLLAITPKLRAFAISLVGDPVRADDLVQDTIVRTLQKRHAFAPGTSFQAWTFTIMRNLFCSEYRRRRREVEDVDGAHAARLCVLPEQFGSIQFAELRSALAKLADEQREAVLLVGAAGLTYEEAAQVCGAKVGTIKSRVNRARGRLAELLGYGDGTGLGPDGVTYAALGRDVGRVLADGRR